LTMDGVKIHSSGIPALEIQPRSNGVEWIRGLLHSSTPARSFLKCRC
jgi:hypothetical protein